MITVIVVIVNKEEKKNTQYPRDSSLSSCDVVIVTMLYSYSIRELHGIPDYMNGNDLHTF